MSSELTEEQLLERLAKVREKNKIKEQTRIARLIRLIKEEEEKIRRSDARILALIEETGLDKPAVDALLDGRPVTEEAQDEGS